MVTGGGSGIGFCIAKALLGEGCNVVICGRNKDKLLKAKGALNSGKLHIIQWNVKDISLIAEKINEAASFCGGYLDGIVNNAGIYTGVSGWKPWNETEGTWDDCWNTNLKSAIFITRRFASYLHDNHIEGNILNIASATGAPERSIISSYGAAKAALIRMTHGMAKQVAGMGIVINGLAPGITYSGITPRDMATPAKQAINRVIEPEEIADCALFLLSDAGKIVIGDTLIADGGYCYDH